MKISKQLGTSEILKMTDSQLVAHYLMASYCYYMLNESPTLDEAYDLLCTLLTEKWNSIEHMHKKYINFTDGKVGSAFGEVNSYPKIVVNAALNYTSRIESGKLQKQLGWESLKGPVQIYTVQISLWRHLKSLDISLLDITVKTGCRAFSPRYEHLMQYKSGAMSEEEYTRIYLARMKKSVNLFKDEWNKLLDYKKVALACYCKPGDFCHRHLFKNLMKDYLEKKGRTAVICEEITLDKK